MAVYRVPELDSFQWQQPVEDKDLTTAPVGVEGKRYIIAANGGAWSTGLAKDIAYYYGAAWHFNTPLEGWIVWVKDEDLYYRFDGSNWAILTTVGPTGPQGHTGLQGPPGPNATYDSDLNCLLITIP